MNTIAISISILLASTAITGSAFAQADAAAQPATPPPPDKDAAMLDTKKDEPWCPFFTGWKGGVELGINGSEGNTESFNVRAGANALRKTDSTSTKVTLVYNRSSSDGIVDKNRAEIVAINDWIFAKDSPWRYFIQGTAEYNDFQDWQYRLTLMNGIGYAFIHSERTTFVGRVGVGIRDDLLGADNRIHPEGLLGLDWSHKINERQLITATLEFYPDLLDLSEYRVKAKIEWQLMVDPESKLSLKAGAEDRVDTAPGPGKENNDLDYYVLLVWSF